MRAPADDFGPLFILLGLSILLVLGLDLANEAMENKIAEIEWNLRVERELESASAVRRQRALDAIHSNQRGLK